MIDLRAKPYYLDAQGVKWVKETIASMTLEEKIAQLFINTYDNNEITLKLLVEKLMGKSELKGASPVDAFCGFLDTRI